MTKHISGPCSPAEEDLLDYCNELLQYNNDLSERINLLTNVIIELNKRMEIIEGNKKETYESDN